MKIGILGGKGMLGSDLVEYFGKEHDVDAIDKGNYNDFIGKQYDTLINANGNSRRFWANQNPLEDFEASTVSVYKSMFDFRFEKYVYISSPDVYENPGDPESAKESQGISPHRLSPYGFHKYLGERIVEHYAKDYFILRPAAMLGKGLKKGPVYDILHDEPLFIGPESRIQFITTTEIASIIQALMNGNVKNGIFNAAGKGAVPVKRIAELAGKSLATKPGAEEQHYEMLVEKLEQLFPAKTSEEYLREFLSGASLA